jgi:hypothetical protein
MTTMSPERLTGLLMALRAMAPKDSNPPLAELIRLAESADANGKAQLLPLHTTIQ